MSRYGSTFDETWDINVTHNEGFPYDFPFQFDREEARAITQPTETWDTDIPKTGRYGSQS
uniref:Uncharacterized protein n=1 Tax=viral metagenome TaxID=1070528 RepID=A0A6M3LBD7_9ZZZZ